MSSYFNLELDTTGPILEIVAPNYTQVDLLTDIYINSQENLMEYQEIYFIDSQGIRHDLIFEYNPMYYYGHVQMNDFSAGIGVLYCRLKDEVGNISQQYTKVINLIKGEVMTLKSYVDGMKTESSFNPMRLDFDVYEREIETHFEAMEIAVSIVSGGDYES